MGLNIRAGMRVLYKHDNKWNIGELAYSQNAVVNEKGLFLYIIPKEFIGMPEKDIPYLHDAEINNLFTDVLPLDESLKQYSEYFMTKNEYIKFIDSDDFDRQRENAYFSDGEYIYYPVSKFSENWILKQPFEYIVRSD